MTRGRELLAGLLLGAGGLCLALLVLEFGVRTMHLVPDRFWEPDPLLGARLIPNAEGWWTQEEREFVVPVRINSHGRRDVERPFAKKKGTFRLLILGDSFVEAFHVPLEDVFARVLEGLLAADRSGPPVEVLSAGVSGYGTAAEVLYFERDGRRYQPDGVLLAFYPGNDVKNNSPTLEDTFPPRYAADGTLESVGSARVSGRREGFLFRWQTYRFARKTLLTGFPGLTAPLAEMGLLSPEAGRARQPTDGIPVDYGVYAEPLTEEWEDAWARTEALLGRLHQSVRDSGGRFAVVVLSTRDQLDPNAWDEVLETYPNMRARAWDLEAPMRRVKKWCGRNRVPCTSLVEAFRAEAVRTEEPLHFRHDGHWTPAGHRLAAEVVRPFVERELIQKSEAGVDHEVH